MFKVGEKIICIDENPIRILDIEFSGNGITYGKEYVVDSLTSFGHIWIQNDCDSLTTCEPKLFVDRVSFRKMKLDKICARLEIK
jgi:hypothetical protein